MNNDEPELSPEALEPELSPVLGYMHEHNMLGVRLSATQLPLKRPKDRHHGGAPDNFICHEEPHDRGTRGIYYVADENGEGRLQGSSRIPQELLRPLLKRLDELRVCEIVIGTVPLDGADVAGAAQSATQLALLEATFVDVEEYDEPRDEPCGGFFSVIEGEEFSS